MTAIEKQINLVVEARAMVEGEKLAYAGAYQKWLNENKTIIDVLEATKVVCEEREATLREMALSIFAETQDKKVAPGIGIREVTKYAYNEAEALKWAIEHELALKLDETKFKNHVKADPPDFVVVTTRLICFSMAVIIPSYLSLVLLY